MPIKKVFLSSTSRDLKEYREAAYGAIEGLDGYHCVRMEDFGARDWDADDFCRTKVCECDLFVGILGHLYGSYPEGCEKSYTEREYDSAVGSEVPRLMFVATDAVSPPPSLRESDEIYGKQQAFRKLVDTERIRDSFESPQDLSGKIRQAIYNLESEQKDKNLIQKRVVNVPFQAPPLPKHFISRPEKSGEIKHRLLTCKSDSPGVLVVSALRGLGGIGKTVLASSLASDPDVRKRFSDGVLWTTLGQDPHILSLLNDLIRALGDHEFPTTPQASSAHLRSLLRDLAILLVVDDAWRPEHVTPFLVGGPNCQVLVTTRRAYVADEVDAERYELDEMTPDQSLELFSSRLGRSITGAERRDALLVAESVGYLPMALEQATERIKRNTSWKDLNDALEKEMSFLEGPRRRRTGNTRLKACLNLSFKALYSDDEDAWRAFVWLGILPEDAKITPAMAATLWGFDDKSEAEGLLELLWDEALLLQDKRTQFDEKQKVYRIHDLLHERAGYYVKSPKIPRKEGDLPGLGLELQEAHALFLGRYRKKLQESNLWHTLPDDGYVHSNLVYHMEKANWIKDIHALLKEETPEGWNGWYQARDRLGQTSGFVEDVSRAWKLSEKDMRPGLEVFCAITTTSINSLSANIPMGLIARLVEHEIWTIDQGLAYALQNPHPERRYMAMGLLSSAICTKNPHKALIVAREIRDARFRTMALSDIALKLEDPQEILKEALNVAREIHDERFRAIALAEIAPKIENSQEVLKEALNAAREIRDERFRAVALADIAPKIEESQEILKEALTVAREIRDDRFRSTTLSYIALKLEDPYEVLKEALNIAREICSDFFRAMALVEIAKELEKPQEILKEALAVARDIPDERSKAMVLAEIAPKLEDSQEALTVAREIWSESGREKLVTDATPKLPHPRDFLKDKINIIHDIFDERSKAFELTDITPELYDLQEALKLELTAAREIRVESARAMALVDIASRLSDPQEGLKEALNVARDIKSKFIRAVSLADIAPKLEDPQTVLKEALTVAREIGDQSDRSRAFAVICLKLSNLKDVRKEALSLVHDFGDESSKTLDLVDIASKLPDPHDVFKEVLSLAHDFGDERSKTLDLVDIASKLTGPHDVLKDALCLASVIGKVPLRDGASVETMDESFNPQDPLALTPGIVDVDKSGRDNAFSELVSKLLGTQEVLNQMLPFASVIGIEQSKTLAIACVSPELEVHQKALNEASTFIRSIGDVSSKDRERVKILTKLSDSQEALTLAREIGDLPFRAVAFAHIALKISDPKEALTIAREIPTEFIRDLALANIALKISDPKEALGVAREIRYENLRALLLADIAPKLSGPKEALAVAREIRYENFRYSALVEIAPKLIEMSISELYPLWQETLHILAQRTRKDLLSDLSALVPVILALGGPEALMETARAIEDVGRWWP